MNWNNGEPTNGPGDPENCVAASAAHSGWNDYVCTDGRVHAIVECEVRRKFLVHVLTIHRITDSSN